MSINSQNVLDYPNNNTIFMVWDFNKAESVKEAFKRLCALIINLNNSANVRFPESKASVVMGIGYGAWQFLELPNPLPKEFEEFYTNCRSKTHRSRHQRGFAFSYSRRCKQFLF